MIELTEVTKVYPGDVRALAGVSLSIGAGELVAVVGPSGSGKSTMLHMLGTLDRPTSGRVAVDGYDVSRLSDRALSALRASRIGFVFQQFHLAPGVPVLDNVADGRSSAPIRCSLVDLPEPDGPTTATSSPYPMRTDTSRSAVIPPGYTRLAESNSTTASLTVPPPRN